MAMCLHNEVMHFGAAVTSWSSTAAGTIMKENQSVHAKTNARTHTHVKQEEKKKNFCESGNHTLTVYKGVGKG